MRILEIASHLNGEECLLIHNRALYDQVIDVLATKPEIDVPSKLKDDGWESPHNRQSSYFIKERVALEMRIAPYSPSELFANHLALYVRDEIDVGIEILPMKSLQAEMSSGPGYYEGELYNMIRNGRGVPAVPLVMIGVAP